MVSFDPNFEPNQGPALRSVVVIQPMTTIRKQSSKTSTRLSVLVALATLTFVSSHASDRAGQAPASSVAPAKSDASWEEIKRLGFSKRVEFEAGGARLLAKVETQVDELKAKRAVMKADPTAWDFAMKEMEDARVYLESMLAEVKAATIESTWNDRKEKSGLAWERAQIAFRKVKSSTTS